MENIKKRYGRPKNPERMTNVWVSLSVKNRLKEYRSKQKYLQANVERTKFKQNNDVVKELLDLYDVVSLSMPNLTTASIIRFYRMELEKTNKQQQKLEG